MNRIAYLDHKKKTINHHSHNDDIIRATLAPLYQIERRRVGQFNIPFIVSTASKGGRN